MLDQGQTITIDTEDQVYNLTVFDGYHTERIHRTTEGDTNILGVDHSRLKGGTLEKHLVQLKISVVDPTTSELGTVTINTTFTYPKWADTSIVLNGNTGVQSWIAANLARILTFES